LEFSQFIGKNIEFAILFVASGSYLVYSAMNKSTGGLPEVTTLDTTRLMNAGNGLVLDVRPKDEFVAGRIPKSRNIPLLDLETRADEITKFKDKPVILAGTAANGVKAAATLKKLGFTQVSLLNGGFTSWKQASLPVEK
jgi:rhodanese-related sulfurtransferase